MLGHHALPATSVVTYSRELLAAPLRQLASVLKAVENGSFRPDCTRSGMILDLQGPASSEAAGAQAGDGAVQCESNDKAVPAQNASDHDADEEPAKGSEVEPHSEAASSDSDEGSSSSSSSDGLDEDFQESNAFSNSGQQVDGSCLLYRQSSGKAIHLFPRGSSEQKFVCGRAKTSDDKVLRTMVVTAEWICKQCKVGRPLRDKGALIDALDRRLKRIRQE